MEIDATDAVGSNDWSAADIARAVRSALSCLRGRALSVRVEVSRSGEGHLCRLHARAERGHLVVVECRADLLGEAIESAAHVLEDAIERRIGGSHAEQPRRPRLLLVAGDADVPGNTLHWTALLGNALQADLDVYRWRPSAPVGGSRMVGGHVMRRWRASAMPHAMLSERLISGAADPSAAAGLLAHSRGVEWIVTTGRDGCGAAAVELARVARCPVLVARAPTTNSVLLVATQAQQDHYPALKRAARLALPLHVPVLILHDVSNLPGTAPLMAQVDALAGPWALLQRECRASRWGQCLPGIDVLLASGGDRLSTVLEQARHEDAELIIVSTSAGEGSGSARFAEAVANGALCSVLIVPGNTAAPVLGGAPSRAAFAMTSSRRPRGAVQPLRRLKSTPSVHGLGPKREPAHNGLSPRWPRHVPSGGQRRR